MAIDESSSFGFEHGGHGGLQGALAQQELDGMPATAEAFREQLIDRLNLGFDLALDFMENWKGGYRVTREFLERFEAAACVVIDLAAVETFVFKPSERSRELETLRARIAKRDGAFQAALSRLLRP